MKEELFHTILQVGEKKIENLEIVTHSKKIDASKIFAILQRPKMAKNVCCFDKKNFVLP